MSDQETIKIIRSDPTYRERILIEEIDRFRAALEKLRDGPGNKMVSWKMTWAHSYAEGILNPNK